MKITLKQRIHAILLLTVYLSVLQASFFHVHSINPKADNSVVASERGNHNSTENGVSHTCFLCDFLGTTYVQTSSLSVAQPQEFLVLENLLAEYNAVTNEKSSPCTIRGPCFL